MSWPREWGPLEIAEARIIIGTLEHFCGNKSHTAKALRVSYKFIQYKCKLYAKLGLWHDTRNTPEK